MTRFQALESFMLGSRVARLRQAAGQRTRRLTVVLDGVYDPHNFSAVVRSCEGFGLMDVWVVESHTRIKINPKVTQGAEKWLDIHRRRDPVTCAAELVGAGFELWVAEPDRSCVEVERVPFERKIALVFGNEHQGLSEHMQRAACGRFHIPMPGFVQSLNLSVAVGITLAIGVGERTRRLGCHGDLSQAEQVELVAEWERRSVKHSDKILALLETRREESNALP